MVAADAGDKAMATNAAQDAIARIRECFMMASLDLVASATLPLAPSLGVFAVTKVTQ